MMDDRRWKKVESQHCERQRVVKSWRWESTGLSCWKSSRKLSNSKAKGPNIWH
jgi:hypothetical protein